MVGTYFFITIREHRHPLRPYQGVDERYLPTFPGNIWVILISPSRQQKRLSPLSEEDLHSSKISSLCIYNKHSFADTQELYPPTFLIIYKDIYQPLYPTTLALWTLYQCLPPPIPTRRMKKPKVRLVNVKRTVQSIVSVRTCILKFLLSLKI